MPRLIIYNESPYFYHISEIVYFQISKYLNHDQIQLINCDKSYILTNDNVYLIFMPFSKLNTDFLPEKYILYNFEQFTTDKIWPDNYINFIKKALFVIDYSLANVIKLHTMGIEAYFLPYIRSTINKHINIDKIEKDIDVLFIGNLNQRRREWLKELSDLKCNIKIITNLFFEKSIEYFARSKIILNVHYYDGNSILEVSRILPALENNCIVLSEASQDEYYNQEYKDIIRITNIKNLKQDIIYLLNNYNTIQQQILNNFYQITTYYNIDDISELIRFLKNIIN